MWSADAVWRAGPHLLLYAEVLADDIATESADMPTRGGAQAGARFAPRWRGWDWTLEGEYTRVSNYAYSVFYQDLCQCDWEHQGEPLGYALGPDVENLRLGARVAPSAAWSARAWLQVTHKGEGAIGKPWRPPACGCERRAPCAWSLSGEVTRATTLGAGLKRRLWPRSGLLSPMWLGASFEGLWPDAGEEARFRVRLDAGIGG
jgi:hypothetical protein